MTYGDITGRQLARLIRNLPEHLPISDAYEAEHLPGDHWWRSQRQHLLGWFNELSGPGAYNRQTRGLRARDGYNRFQCAPGLLWLAEALGETPDVVQAAADAAGGVGRPATQCAAIRRVIPWERIEELVGSLPVRQGDERRAPVRVSSTARQHPRVVHRSAKAR